MSSNTEPARFSELVSLVTPYKHTLALALLLMLGGSILGLATPWMAGKLTFALTNGVPPLGLSTTDFLWLWLGIFALQGLFSFGNQYLVGKTSEQMLARLRMRLYEHLQALPLSFYHERKRGEILTLMTNDITNINNFVTHTLLSLLPLLVSFFGALTLIALIDPMIALLISIFLPLFFIATKLLGRRIHPVTRKMIDAHAATFSVVEENLGLLPVIKSFTREEHERKRFQKDNQRLFEVTRDYQHIQAILTPSIQFLASAGILLLLAMGIQKIDSGQMTPADLVSLLLYTMMLTRPISGLADTYGQVQRTRGSAERLLEVFSISPEPEDTGKQELAPIKGKVEFRNIRFSYPGRKPVLDNLNLSIKAGETIAITGENGAGKSTLAHLLLRFDEPDKGGIFIDSTPISKVSLYSLRSQIGLVQQQVLLLNGPVRDNIAFGNPTASEEEIRQAAKAAHALDFIESLPQGFDTIIGDQGIKLSGGQKQRLSLARVLLKDPPILILDEATAMFDPAGEISFIRECHDLLHQRTVLLITHRPESLKLADRTLVLKDGRLNELK